MLTYSQTRLLEIHTALSIVPEERKKERRKEYLTKKKGKEKEGKYKEESTCTFLPRNTRSDENGGFDEILSHRVNVHGFYDSGGFSSNSSMRN